VYEVIWSRLLHIILGSTTYAVSLVLTAFMAGLAIGSFYSGRLIDRRTEILKIYAYIEVGIALLALLSPVLLNALNPLYVWLHERMLNSLQFLNLIRFILSFAVLAVPAALIGATLPVLSKFFVRKRSELGTDIGGLYGFNTLGATVGCFITGFFLIEAIGVRRTIFLAATINLTIAAVVFLLRKRFASAWAAPNKGRVADVTLREPQMKKQFTLTGSLPRLVILAFALSGFVSLGYEVLWTRAISFFAGNTSYAFSTMLTTFLLGLAFGSIAVSRFCDKMRNLLTGFGIAEILIGFCGIASIALFARLFRLLEPTAYGESGATPVWMKFTFSFLVMLLPTLLMGAIFPIVSKLYTRGLDRLGRSIGDIYSINTVGGIIGSLVAPFILIPAVGIQKGILLLAVLNLAIGIILIAYNPKTAQTRKYAYIVSTVLFAMVLIVAIPVGENTYSSAGSPIMPSGSSIYYEEGVATTVEILEDSHGNRHLILDGGVNASTTSIGVGTRVHMLMAQLPLLLHENPRSILLIALGSGMTAGATLAFESLEVIDCAEISEDVVRATSYFSGWNHNIVNSPRFNLYIEDGRNFVLTATRKYDVISTGIVHPKHNTGNASLYSEDYYRICRSKLNEGGVICQWAPLYGLTMTEFKMILRTFHKVFPHTSLWFAQSFGSLGNSNALLIGSQDGSTIDYSRLERNFQQARVTSDMESEGINEIPELLDCFVMGRKVLAEFVSGEIDVTTDDRPLLEFGAIEMHYSEILAELVSKREPVWPHLSFAEGTLTIDTARMYGKLREYFEISNKCIQGDIYNLRKDYDKALAEYGSALKMAPDQGDILNQFLEIQTHAHKHLVREFLKRKGGQASDLNQFLQMLEINPTDAEAVFRIGFVYQNVGWLDAAIGQYEQVLRIDPGNSQARHNLAVAYSKKGWYDKALQELETVITLNPSFSESYAYAGFIYVGRGDTNRAIELLEKALEADSTNEIAKKHLSKLK